MAKSDSVSNPINDSNDIVNITQHATTVTVDGPYSNKFQLYFMHFCFAFISRMWDFAIILLIATLSNNSLRLVVVVVVVVVEEEEVVVVVVVVVV